MTIEILKRNADIADKSFAKLKPWQQEMILQTIKGTRNKEYGYPLGSACRNGCQTTCGCSR